MPSPAECLGSHILVEKADPVLIYVNVDNFLSVQGQKVCFLHYLILHTDFFFFIT